MIWSSFDSAPTEARVPLLLPVPRAYGCDPHRGDSALVAEAV